MTQENQALTSDLAAGVFECEGLHQRLAELTSANSQMEQKNRGLEIELEDLLDTYRNVLIEKNRVESDLSAMG